MRLLRGVVMNCKQLLQEIRIESSVAVMATRLQKKQI